MKTRIVGAALFAALLVAPAVAEGVAPDAVASGFRCTGTLVVRAAIAGSPLDVGGNIALYRRGSKYRLDVISLGFPGTDPTLSAAAGALLVPGGATLLYDGATGAVSAHSNTNRVFYDDPPKPAPGRPHASPPPGAPGVGAADPLAALAGVVRQLSDAAPLSSGFRACPFGLRHTMQLVSLGISGVARLRHDKSAERRWPRCQSDLPLAFVSDPA